MHPCGHTLAVLTGCTSSSPGPWGNGQDLGHEAGLFVPLLVPSLLSGDSSSGVAAQCPVIGPLPQVLQCQGSGIPKHAMDGFCNPEVGQVVSLELNLGLFLHCGLEKPYLTSMPPSQKKENVPD